MIGEIDLSGKVWFVLAADFGLTANRLAGGPFKTLADAEQFMAHSKLHGLLQRALPVLAPYTLTKGHDNE